MQVRWEQVSAAVAAAGWEAGGCHDLLHRPFTSTCREQPGGPLRHLELWWRYRGCAGVKRRVACRVGRHRHLPYWTGTAGPDDAPEGLLCLNCGGR